VEEVCFGHPLVLRGKSIGKNPVYYVLGANVRRTLSLLHRDRFAGLEGVSRHRPTDDQERGTTFQAVEEALNMSRIPQIDSIEELAKFWDTHDITDFEDELEEVEEPIFDRGTQAMMRIRLLPEQAEALKRIARSRGIDEAELVKEWVNEKLRAG
jgi:protein tyrosine phosphatase (PTP) superfamily phosphohydrolase (DUF442 family)